MNEEILEEFWYGLKDYEKDLILNNCLDEYDKFLQGKEFDVELVKRHVEANYSKFVLRARKGKLSIVKAYIKLGVDFRAHNDWPLRCSCYYGELDVVKYLVKLGADVHANNEDALRWASFYGKLDVVKYLVEQGADIHAGDDDDALKKARTNGKMAVVDYLQSLS